MSSDMMDRADFPQSALDKALAELAAANERAAALAAALEHFRGALRLTIPINPRLAELDIDPAAILADLRRAAKREALEGLPLSMSRPRLRDYPDDDERMEREAFALGFNAYRAHIDAALAALDAEEKGEQHG